MGICASCLGVDRRASRPDPSDASRLLGDAYEPQYGAINAKGSHAGGPQLDAEEIRRQRDALERLCAQTSDKLIDVTQSPSVEEASAKIVQDYSRLFSQRFPSSRPVSGASSASSVSEGNEVGWLARLIEVGSNGNKGEWDEVGGAKKRRGNGVLSMPVGEGLDGGKGKGGRG